MISCSVVRSQNPSTTEAPTYRADTSNVVFTNFNGKELVVDDDIYIHRVTLADNHSLLSDGNTFS